MSYLGDISAGGKAATKHRNDLSWILIRFTIYGQQIHPLEKVVMVQTSGPQH